MNKCSFCGTDKFIRMHHLVPKCKGGKETIPTCQNCESFIHSTWSHNELRDVYYTVESLLKHPKFQIYLKWKKKQKEDTAFRSTPGRFRNKKKYS